MVGRDGRGNPGRIVLKNRPRLKLNDLLRRRKMTLKQMLDEFGISTYEKLSERCKRMGVVVPERIEFDTVMPPSSYVNNPTQGLIVLDAIPIDQVDVDVAKKHKRKKLTLNDDVVESLIESE